MRAYVRENDVDAMLGRRFSRFKYACLRIDSNFWKYTTKVMSLLNNGMRMKIFLGLRPFEDLLAKYSDYETDFPLFGRDGECSLKKYEVRVQLIVLKTSAHSGTALIPLIAQLRREIADDHIETTCIHDRLEFMMPVEGV